MKLPDEFNTQPACILDLDGAQMHEGQAQIVDANTTYITIEDNATIKLIPWSAISQVKTLKPQKKEQTTTETA